MAPKKKKQEKPETTLEQVVRRLYQFVDTHFPDSDVLNYAVHKWIFIKYLEVLLRENPLRSEKQKRWAKFQKREILDSYQRHSVVLNQHYVDRSILDRRLLRLDIQTTLNQIKYFYDSILPRAKIPEILTRWENLYTIHNIAQKKLIVANMSPEMRQAYELMTEEFRYATSELNINTLILSAAIRYGYPRMQDVAFVANLSLLSAPLHNAQRADQEEQQFKTEMENLWKLRFFLALDVPIDEWILHDQLHTDKRILDRLNDETQKHKWDDVDRLHHQFPYEFPRHRQLFSLDPAVRKLEKKWKKEAREKPPMSSPRKRELEEWKSARDKALAEEAQS